MKLRRVFGAMENLMATGLKKLVHGKKLNTTGIPGLRFDTQIITDGGEIALGEKVRLSNRISLTATDGGIMQIGDRVNLNRNCIFICRRRIKIDEGCSFGPNVVIYDHDHEFDTSGIQPGFKYGEVVIDANCWIGAGVTILRGTHIGAGCVIGAGAVVKGDIPAHSLVTGERTLKIRPIEDR